MPRAIVDGVNNPVDSVIAVIGEVQVTMPRTATAYVTAPATWRCWRRCAGPHVGLGIRSWLESLVSRAQFDAKAAKSGR